MAKTEIIASQIKNATIGRSDLVTGTSGEAVVAKLVQGSGVSLSSTGADAGTGDVTVGLGISGLTEDTSPDSAADYVVTYDGSASAHKKVKLSNLPGGGSPSYSWSAQAHNSGHFAASGSMTWTVDSGDLTFSNYVEIGKTMVWSLFINNATVGGTASTELRATVPNSKTANRAAGGVFYFKPSSAGAWSQGWWEVAASSTYVSFYRTPAKDTNWVVSTNDVKLMGEFIFEVQ